MMLPNSGGLFQGSTGRKDKQEKRNAPVMELLFAPLWFLSSLDRGAMEFDLR